MDIFIPIITSTAQILVGRYRLSFSVDRNADDLPIITEPRSISIAGKSAMINRTELSADKQNYYVYLELKENPIPVMVVVVGVLIVLGLSLIYLTFRSIEKIVETSPVAVAGFAVGGLLLIGFLTTKKFL